MSEDIAVAEPGIQITSDFSAADHEKVAQAMRAIGAAGITLTPNQTLHILQKLLFDPATPFDDPKAFEKVMARAIEDALTLDASDLPLLSEVTTAQEESSYRDDLAAAVESLLGIPVVRETVDASQLEAMKSPLKDLKVAHAPITTAFILAKKALSSSSN